MTGAWQRMDERSTAAPRSVVVAGNARFTVLTPTLLRLEYAPDGVFENRPTLFAVCRELPIPPFETRREGKRVVLETEALTLCYSEDGARFGENNLRIRLRSRPPTEWKPGMLNKGNLRGTVCTLDECKGRIALPDGVLSRDGWFLLDDSLGPVFEKGWVAARNDVGQQDWYFFGYGRDYARALKDLTTLSGPIPLPPRFAFGSWYSRYWPYRAEELLAIADEYARYEFPLDVMVIDMDWHLDGWTGYTWNRELIPDPKGLLSALHRRGLKTTLNLHPADGVQAHEEAYPTFAEAMGSDAAPDTSINFNCTDPVYMKNYFELLHHPLEAQGVDFWWIDWQQSAKTPVAGLAPLSWLNHLHFCDLKRERPPRPSRRGLTLSRWAGWGNHRYPIQFSGDTWATWDMLRFLVEFTATAGNVGAAYWSHDLGGHFAEGRTDPELFIRWIQFGAFSATMRVHAARCAENDRRPWLDGEPFTSAARAAFALRYRLLPYIYTMARKCHDTGLPLNRPMYLADGNRGIAYELPDQFYFGDDLIVAPVLRPGRGPDRVAEVQVWLPEGDWFDLTTHKHFAGSRRHGILAALNTIPVFVRAGHPIPLARPGRSRCAEDLDKVHLRVYPGADGETHLYEDDGESSGYLAGQFAWTPLRYRAASNRCHVRIGPATGTYKGMPRIRQIVVELPATRPPITVTRDGQSIPRHQWGYDTSTETTTVRIPRVTCTEACAIVIEFAEKGA